MSARGFGLWAAIFLSSALLPAPAPAASIETLMMPGDVIEGHAKYEDDCENCHERFRKSGQDRLCRDCHEEVAADVERRQGFHGVVMRRDDIECRQCHTEHRGREADIVNMNEETFDHDRTDFSLGGAHGVLRCARCHDQGKKYREAQGRCSDCHGDDSPHRDEIGSACGDCHNDSSWVTTRFDHDRTDFPLEGSHRDAACAVCHPNERYKDIATECHACHRLNDVHRGRYGEKCQDCHDENEWDDVHFDHDRDTRYRLEGRHRRVPCDACHTGDLYEQALDTECAGCHRNDDDHKGQFGDKCADCHTARSWERHHFDHEDDADYRLEGAHGELKCVDCHGGHLYEDELETGCVHCHEKDDVHGDQQSEYCGRCHNARSWGARIVFDHDVTRFPLIGAHAVAPCEECHLTARFRDADSACHACHERDDEHRGRLGRSCGLCHNPNGWMRWVFDHDTQTDFGLDGAHGELGCYSCHVSAVSRIRQSTDCGACHQRDDVHGGGFGRRCERCHDTESFTHIRIGRQAPPDRRLFMQQG